MRAHPLSRRQWINITVACALASLAGFVMAFTFHWARVAYEVLWDRGFF